jgi:hypothetical protein
MDAAMLALGAFNKTSVRVVCHTLFNVPQGVTEVMFLLF